MEVTNTHTQASGKMQFGNELQILKSLWKFWDTGGDDRKDQSVPSVQVAHCSYRVTDCCTVKGILTECKTQSQLHRPQHALKTEGADCRGQTADSVAWWQFVLWTYEGGRTLTCDNESNRGNPRISLSRHLFSEKFLQPVITTVLHACECSGLVLYVRRMTADSS
jgi:hypothetical protein